MHEKEFYEKAYGKSSNAARPDSEDFFHRITKRYELHREDAVWQILDPGNRLLELGCGDGGLLLRSLDKFKQVIGLDITPQRLKRVQARVPGSDKGRVRLLEVNLNDGIPNDIAKVDAVICVAVLEHVFDPIFLVAEMSRILEPGGQVVIQVPNIAYLYHRVFLGLGQLPRTSGAEEGWDGGHLHYFTMSTLCMLLAQQGFKVVKKTGTGRFARLRSWWPSLLCGDLVVKGIKV